jgi:hypothetical protein
METKQLIEQTKDFMKRHHLNAAEMKRLGELAVDAIGSNEAYQQFREVVIEAGFMTDQELPEEKNYMTLMALGTMGELAGEK